jgi:chemotaxis signal transduction protein
MAAYKGIEMESSLERLMRFMRGVEDYREALVRLQGSWDTLALLGQLTGTATEMSGTREAFGTLTGDLLIHLGQETLRKTVADLRAKAQNSINILVRNLFERTADIGFLAADVDVREFLESQEADDARPAIEARFREYVAKYSVYSDIILLDAHGKVKARLQPSPIEQTAHPIVSDAIATRAAYVEYFGEIDLLPPGNHLLYAYRVKGCGDTAVGVLILTFRLSDELIGIFRNLIDENDWAMLCCATAQGEVIGSSSRLLFPVGSVLPPTALGANGELVRYEGRLFLAVACEAAGYQGYMGPGWLGIALIPVDVAFERSHSGQAAAGFDHQLLEALMQRSALFSDALRGIPTEAGRIQEDLNRSVWNGSVRQAESSEFNAAFSKTLLWEISNAGRRTQEVFEQSISNLYETVVAAAMQDVKSRAAFAIDVMDRNLYERANDCRWWALNAAFRRILAQKTIDADGAQACAEILRTINDLYTVYENLLLFDADGRVVAVSRERHAHLVGGRIEADWVRRTLALQGSQDYAVSAFEPTPLYGDQPTYVYAAAIRDPNGHRAVGGVAIVFDATPQFTAMLGDAMPRDAAGEIVSGAFTAFVGADGTVIASSDPRFPTRSALPDDLYPQGLAAGAGVSRIVELEGTHYAIGATMSAGYREFKVSDGYRNAVAALCALPLGNVRGAQLRQRRATTSGTRGRRAGSGDKLVELATFFVGSYWFGVPARRVIEAVDTEGLRRANGNGALAGYKMHRGAPVAVIHLERVLGLASGAQEHRQIVLVRLRDDTPMGILVDELGEIPEIPESDILPLQGKLVGDTSGVSSVVRNLDADALLTVLDLDGLAAKIVDDRPALKLAG